MVFREWGLSKDITEKATAEIIKDKDQWVRFMMKHELGLEAPDPRRARKSAFNIGISYIIGGLVPLCPYFFLQNPIDGLKLSAIITLLCLYIFGYFKSKMTGVHPFIGGLKVMLIGAAAAGTAFMIAKLIQGH